MSKTRWLAPWKDSAEKPAIYHCLSRVVDWIRNAGNRMSRTSTVAFWAIARKQGRSSIAGVPTVTRTDEEMLAMTPGENEKMLPHIGLAEMLGHRVRYFTHGAVIGSRTFVNEVFVAARDRFTPGRADGARRLRGNGKPAAGILWSIRDLRVDIR